MKEDSTSKEPKKSSLLESMQNCRPLFVYTLFVVLGRFPRKAIGRAEETEGGEATGIVTTGCVPLSSGQNDTLINT